jgi:Uma2 family endonuclease
MGPRSPPRAGVVLTSPADISWGQDVLVQPDVFVVPVEQARTLEWSAIRHLLLVAEVLSPSTPRHDRFTKRRRYQEARVPLYWIVDGEELQVGAKLALSSSPSGAMILDEDAVRPGTLSQGRAARAIPDIGPGPGVRGVHPSAGG